MPRAVGEGNLTPHFVPCLSEITPLLLDVLCPENCFLIYFVIFSFIASGRRSDIVLLLLLGQKQKSKTIDTDIEVIQKSVWIKGWREELS